MLAEIAVIAELDRCAVEYKHSGDDEVQIRCPFHDDQTPSCNVNIKKRVFNCNPCGAKGDIVTLLAGLTKHTRSEALDDLATRYELTDVKIVEPEVVERWHNAIWGCELLPELYLRAVTDDIIRKRKVGYDADAGRITIPVYNIAGDCVNVRKYLPGAPSNEKMKNLRGRGSVRWVPIDQLKYDTIMLCGGELKAFVAAEQLNPHGVGAIWATYSEKVLPANLLKELAGKSLAWCLDIDQTGRKAARGNCQAAKGLAAEQFDLLLPLDPVKYPKGDINDFVFNGGKLWDVLQAAEPWVDTYTNDLDMGPATPISLAAASHADQTGKRVEVSAIPSAMITPSYVVPKEYTVKCDKSQKEMCSLCPVFPSVDGKFTISSESPSILDMVASPTHMVNGAVQKATGIPPLCRVCSFNVESYYNVEDVRLSPQIELTDRTASQKVQPAICIGNGIDLNNSYKMVGRMWPHPKTQQSTLLISGYEQTRDALQSYEPRTADLEALRIFQPDAWTVEGVQSRLDAIYADFEQSVTRIYQRRELHLAVDLTYHSPLFVKLQNDIANGWVQTLIVGDSAQGKSETAERLMLHYGLGERIECKNATRAGLMGGSKSMNDRWFIEWGYWVKHDQRLLILEEIKGMTVETISKLTDMRSSGLADIVQIEKLRAHARTRTLWISNPRPDGRRVNSYGFRGVDVIRELIGGLEDVRRFDLCVCVADNEVDMATINRLHAARNGAHCKHTSELCRSLILWAWTRTVEQCVFDKEVAKVVLDESLRLSEIFNDNIPIIDKGSTRFKVARLAAALAARTFSTTDDKYTAIDVKPCHVLYISQMLERLYSKPAFGYLDFSKATKLVEEIKDVDQIRKVVAALPFPHDFIESLLRTDSFDLQDVQDWCSYGREEAMLLVSMLVRKHALRREGRLYRKTLPFVDMLRGLQSSTPDRPNFIPEGEF